MTSYSEHSMKIRLASSKFQSNLSHSLNKCTSLPNSQKYTNTFFTIIVIQQFTVILSSFRTYYSEKEEKSKKLDILPAIWIEISIFSCIFWFWGICHMWVGSETEMLYWGVIIIHILFLGKIIFVSEPSHMW